ncbi:MAG: ROK family protein [Polyangiaceae bacterium]|nr:ROK family protein [Polyangiaceae bacterium]
MRTLCIDIGGTGIKAIVLDREGKPLSERGRVETPDPAVPPAVLSILEELARGQGEFDRISIGFPGVVIEGVTFTAPNLDPSWADFPLASEIEKLFQKPARIANDADIQGLAVIEGTGVEMLITLGTGMGAGLYIDGRLVPNLELGHHPFRNDKTYEERVCNAERKRIGNEKWNRRVRQVVKQLGPIFNYRVLYVGGGNARHLEANRLPKNIRIVENVAGLLGGIRLWQDEPARSGAPANA